MLKRYFMTLIVCLSVVAGVRAEIEALYDMGVRAAERDNSVKTANEAQKKAEYYKRIDTFTRAADYYLQNCLSDKNDPKCTASLDIINEHLFWAATYYSPDSWDKRIEVKNALYEKTVADRTDIGDFEKGVLSKCFGFGKDNYAQTSFEYHRGTDCDKLIKEAVEIYGSKDSSINQQYARIIERENEEARIARLDALINNLALPIENKNHKKTVTLLANNLNLFKEVLQRLKRMPWVVYRMVGEPLQGNRVYPGLFKPYIDQTKVTARDAKIINALIFILDIYDYAPRPKHKGNTIPEEPTYQEQKAAGLDFEHTIGEGFSVAWALQRYDLFSQYVIQDPNKLNNLSKSAKAKIIDDLIIRCGNREMNTVARNEGRQCARWITTLTPLLNEFGVKIVDKK